MDNSKKSKKSIDELMNHSVDGNEIKGGQGYNDDGTIIEDDPAGFVIITPHDKVSNEKSQDNWDGAVNTTHK